MFERFTRDARDTVVRAQEVGRTMASRSIDTRHLLVALAEANGPAKWALRTNSVDTAMLARQIRADLRDAGLDRDALASLGIDLDAVSERADAVFGQGALLRAGRRRGHIAFTAEAKKALELSLREALRLKKRTIDSSHLLLGILRAECSARDVLAAHDVDLDALRRTLEQPTAQSA
jgi:ATP-dependent Clp protease ATP-binding subunit ClpA